MNCREANDFLMDYLAGELPVDTHATFEIHLGRCKNCQVFLAQYQSTVKAGKHACAEDAADAKTELPAELLDAIVAAIRKQTP